MASLPTRRLVIFKPTGFGFLLALWIGFVEIKAGEDYSKSLTLGNSQRPFDYFMLSLLWPATSCRSARHCCPSNACCQSSNVLTEFTIHGLWTDYNDGTWPACCSGKRFDVKEISSLLSTLNKYWPSLSCDSPSNCHGGKGLFWEHEWEKHGTCSNPVIRDEYDYFVTALNLYFKYNVTEVLKEAGYVASNSEKYPLGGIVSAIQNAFHATPQLVCSGDNVDELRLCFYKDLKVRDCDVESSTKRGSIKSDTPCPRYVRLREIVSSSEFNFLQVKSNGYNRHDIVNIVSDE